MYKKGIKTSMVLLLALCLILTSALCGGSIDAFAQEQAKVFAGQSHSLVIKPDGTLWGFGDNTYGQLGDGTKLDRTSPVKIMDDVKWASAGNQHSLAVKTDGSLWAFGNNNYGQLGDGTKNISLVPVKILDNVSKCSAGYYFSLALKTDGTLWSVGFNKFGQLGDKTNTDKLLPVCIASNVIDITAGQNYAMYITDDKKLYAFGANDKAQLGDGTNINRNYPVYITDDVIEASAGNVNSFAIKSDNKLYAWGSGILGTAESVDRVGVTYAMDDVQAVSNGMSHTLVLKKDGTLYAFGDNNEGKLGTGNTNLSRLPVKISDRIIAIAAGARHSLVIKPDGSVWSCGRNADGQLGCSSTTDRLELTDITAKESISNNYVVAAPTSSKILINGKEVKFEAYLINGNNYFKLRDIAMALKNTSKKFQVTYDATANAVRVFSNKDYWPVGGELAVPATPTAKPAVESSLRNVFDYSQARIKAYYIGGNNYYKLKEIGELLDFYIGYDNVTKNIVIDTDKPHEYPEGQPVLKWKNGGKYDTEWVAEAYYSTPVVTDINRDGKLEIIAASYSIMCIDAATGKLNWRVNTGADITNSNKEHTGSAGRVWCDVIVEDIDKDGKDEIIVGSKKGYVAVYDANGKFKSGWPQKTVGDDREVKSLKVVDLDGDGTCEIIAGFSGGSALNIWVFEHDGKVRHGWPQLGDQFNGTINNNNNDLSIRNSTAYAWGVFNDSIAVGDINDDGKLEIIVPSDNRFICAYDINGGLIPASSIFGGRTWGKIGTWENYEYEKQVINEGWGDVNLNSPDDIRVAAQFAHAGTVITDVNGDGKNEVVISARMFDSPSGFPPSLYETVFIFQGNRERFKVGKYDWTTVPKTSSPINSAAEDYSIIESAMNNPVVEDIDGDGLKEILTCTYDGKVHCYWLNKEEKHSWPFKVYSEEKNTVEFASKPTVIDINNDQKKEVIITTWTEKDAKVDGRLLILNYKGEVLQTVNLPGSLGSTKTNGCLAAPLVQDIDDDGKYEIILNTVYSGIVVYDLD